MTSRGTSATASDTQLSRALEVALELTFPKDTTCTCACMHACLQLHPPLLLEDYTSIKPYFERTRSAILAGLTRPPKKRKGTVRMAPTKYTLTDTAMIGFAYLNENVISKKKSLDCRSY